MPPTNTLVDDLSLSDEEDVGLEEGQGFGGGGGDEEEGPRNPSDGGTTTRSAKSSSLDFWFRSSEKYEKEERGDKRGVSKTSLRKKETPEYLWPKRI